MPCYRFKTGDGVSGIICGRLGSHCADCAAPAEILCDYPVRKGKTCDRKICIDHAHEIGPNMHYCESHWRMWNKEAAKLGTDPIAPSQILPLFPDLKS